jgi:hypothetical protein
VAGNTSDRRIVDVDLHFPKHVSEDARDFVRRLLKRNPNDRMGDLSQVQSHPWIVKNRAGVATSSK